MPSAALLLLTLPALAAGSPCSTVFPAEAWLAGQHWSWGGPQTSAAVLQLSARTSSESEKRRGMPFLICDATRGSLGAVLRLAELYSDNEVEGLYDPQRSARLYQQAAAAGDNAGRVQLALLLLDGKSLPLDVNRAMGLLQDAAKTGDVWSTTLLAGLYTTGDKVPADGQRALDLLAPLVQKHTAAALTATGDVYAKGPAPIKADPSRAADFYEQAVALGDVLAKSRLGTMLVSGQGEPASRGLTLLEDVAAAGDNWTLIQIGNLYAAGNAVPIDAQKALDHFQLAAQRGLPVGFSLMGNVYNHGLGTIAKDPAQAAKLYAQAAAAGDNTGRVQLALLLLDGKSLPLDVNRAMGLLQDAAKTGDVWSTTLLAGLYTTGDKVPADGQRALDLLAPLVQKHTAAALTATGDVYAKGPAPIKADPSRAADFYEQAVALGDVLAKSRLGTMLVSGQGEPASRGLTLLEDVAAAGDNWTLIQIGNLYAAGNAVPIDAQKALDHFQLAAQRGLPVGFSLMGNVYNHGLGTIAKDPAQAAKLYAQAAAAGDNTGRVQLALLLLDGKSLPLDVNRAMGLLQDAAKTGDVWSTTILGSLYATGRFVPANYEQAKTYFLAAQALGSKDAMLQFGEALSSGPLAKLHAAEGADLIARAFKAGVANSTVPYAQLEIAKNNAGDAVAHLELASASGDQTAIRYLIQINRDGVQGRLAARPDVAEQVLNQYRDKLPPDVQSLESVHLIGLRPPSIDNFETLAAEFQRLRPDDVSPTLNDLLWRSPNSYVFVLQQRMAAQGTYHGPLNGLLTKSTIAAIGTTCGRLGVSATCAKGVMSSDAASALGAWLAKTP